MIAFGAPVLVLTAALMAQAEAAPDPGPPDGAGAAARAQFPQGDYSSPLPGPLYVEAAVRMAYRLPPASDVAGPPLGIGFGLLLARRYAVLGRRLELAAAVDFGYAHHSKGVTGVRRLPSGAQETFDGEQVISENTFGVLHMFNLLFQHVRPWVGLGGGLAVGYFESDQPSFRPGATRAYRPYGHIAAGVNVPLAAPIYVDIRFDYHLILASPKFTPEDGVDQQVMGDLISLGVALGSRFP